MLMLRYNIAMGSRLLKSLSLWMAGLTATAKIAGVVIASGTALTYPLTDGWCTKPVETLTKIETVSVAYDTTSIKKGSLERGQSETKSAGKAGLKENTYQLSTHCGREKDKKLTAEKITQPPVAEEVFTGTRHLERVNQPIPYGTKRVPNAYAAEGATGIQTKGQTGTKFVNYQVSQDEGQPEVRTVVSEGVITPAIDEVVWYGKPRYRVGAICWDGWRSSATGSGACSWHGGVQTWLHNW